MPAIPPLKFPLQDKLNPNIVGIIWMLIAGLFFSVMVALIKLLGARFPSVEIVFFRSVIQLCVLSVVFWRIGFSSLKTNRPLLHGFRALIAIALINCNFYAFTQLPMADVTAIGFSRNLFVVVLTTASCHSYRVMFVSVRYGFYTERGRSA